MSCFIFRSLLRTSSIKSSSFQIFFSIFVILFTQKCKQLFTHLKINKMVFFFQSIHN